MPTLPRQRLVSFADYKQKDWVVKASQIAIHSFLKAYTVPVQIDAHKTGKIDEMRLFVDFALQSGWLVKHS